MAKNNSEETMEKNNQEEKRTMTKYDRKMQRRLEEELQRKKRKRAVMGTGIVFLAICIIAAAFLIYAKVASSISYIKVDDKSISQSEFEFYYNQVVNTYASTYSAYGLDTTQPLDQQQCLLDSSMTWKDYFEKAATEQLVYVKALIKDADANGFREDVNKEYDNNVKAIAETAKNNNMSEKDYYKNTFGDAKEDVEEYMKETIRANLWYAEVSKKQEVTDEEIASYYEENKEDYDYVSYYISEVTAEGVTVGSSSDEEITTAMALAKTKAETQLAGIETSGSLIEEGVVSGMKTILYDWLFAEERKKGDTTVLEDSGSAMCYALKFVERKRNEEPTVDFYAVVTSDEDADADKILKEWESGEKTQESFIDLVEKYSGNTSVEDGFYEAVSEDDMSAAEGLSDWIFEEKRKEGDTMAITTEDGTKYVVYYKGENDPYYKVAIRSNLINTAMQEYVKKLTDPLKVADPNGVLNYLQQADNEG